MAGTYARYSGLSGSGGGTSGVSSLNGLTGALTLVAGANVTITPGSGTLTIASTGGGGGSGTVTSVDVSVPSFLTSSGGPITTSGTIAITLNDEPANTVFAGPASGADAPPTFRALVPADVPGLVGSPNVLAYYDAGGDLAPLGQWSVDPVDFNLTSIVSISDTRTSYDQIRLQTNLGGTITSNASSLNLALSSAGSTASLTGINLGVSGTVVGSVTLINAGSSANASGDITGLELSLNGGAFGNQIAMRADVAGTVVGDSTGLFLNMDAAVSGNSSVFNESVTSSIAGSLNFVSLSGNGSAVVGGDFRAINSGMNGDVSGFAAGALIFQGGVVTKGYTGFGSNTNANIGDGSGVSAIGFDASFQNGTINGGLFGFNFNNSNPITGPYTAYGLNVNNGSTGTGFNFIGASVNNQANQSESFTGVSISNNANSRVATGINLSMQGTITDDAAGARINLNGLTSTSSNITGLSIQMGSATDTNPQGVIGISSDGRIQVNATTQLSAGQGFQIGNRVESAFSIPNGSPVTGTDSLGNNLAGDLLAQDNLSNGGFGIGWNGTGFISSVGVAATKTVQAATAFLPAVTFPDPGFTTGGTITDLHIIRTFAPLMQGGSISITNLYGFKIDPAFGNFTDNATNAWGIWVGDTTANNYFAKNIGIGQQVPTARLDLPAVTTSAGSASLKIAAGTLMTAPEQGAVESDGTDLWWTDGTGTRQQLNGGGSPSPVSFTLANNQTSPANVAGFLVNNVTNQAWESAVSISRRYSDSFSLDSPFSAGFLNTTGTVRAVAAQADGSIIFVGSFTTFQGLARNYISRVSPAGVEDATFYTNLGTGFDANILSVDIQADQKIVVGGTFTTLNGVAAAGLARINADGTPDTAFNANSTGTSESCRMVKVLASQKILSGSTTLTRYNTDGTPDGTFTTSAYNTTFSIGIAAVGELSDTRVAVVGGFTTVNAASFPFAVMIDNVGAVDASWTTAIGGAPNATANAIAIQSDDAAVIVGQFTSVGGGTQNHIVRISSAGVVDSAFTTAIGTGLLNPGNAVKILSNGKIAVGGSFTQVNGLSAIRIALLTSAGAVDSGFNSFITTGFNGVVLGLAIDFKDEIFAGGSFTSFNSAAYSGGMGLITITELVSEQTLRGVYRPAYLSWSVGGSTAVGDNTGVVYTMNSSGQLQYVSSNIVGTLIESQMKFILTGV